MFSMRLIIYGTSNVYTMHIIVSTVQPIRSRTKLVNVWIVPMGSCPLTRPRCQRFLLLICLLPPSRSSVTLLSVLPRVFLVSKRPLYSFKYNAYVWVFFICLFSFIVPFWTGFYESAKVAASALRNGTVRPLNATTPTSIATSNLISLHANCMDGMPVTGKARFEPKEKYFMNLDSWFI